ncbi:unnamed protein product [Moneuplotes crassus]|uniref:Uncharacterized protein n=1 Tax=Euplotes crassus TaxID=5936 RepID=A0AAD1XZ45_EUPCR|nr:unnamed protein product [Moneuplotes crassus]
MAMNLKQIRLADLTDSKNWIGSSEGDKFIWFGFKTPFQIPFFQSSGVERRYSLDEGRGIKVERITYLVMEFDTYEGTGTSPCEEMVTYFNQIQEDAKKRNEDIRQKLMSYSEFNKLCEFLCNFKIHTGEDAATLFPSEISQACNSTLVLAHSEVSYIEENLPNEEEKGGENENEANDIQGDEQDVHKQITPFFKELIAKFEEKKDAKDKQDIWRVMFHKLQTDECVDIIEHLQWAMEYPTKIGKFIFMLHNHLFKEDKEMKGVIIKRKKYENIQKIAKGTFYIINFKPFERKPVPRA